MTAEPRALLKGAALLVMALVAGWAIGTALGASPGAPEPDPVASPTSHAQLSPRPLPSADAAGRDLDRLPRYPGSIRTAYRETTDDQYGLVATEYLADATVEEVRGFYQSVIGRHGWQRADIAYDDGEWVYILVDGRIEALIEIDLQISTPVPAPAPEPTARPASPPPPAPPAPAPPPGGGNDDDDDDGTDDDDDGADDD